MKLFLVFSLTLCSRLLGSSAGPPSIWALALLFCVYLLFSYLFAAVLSLTAQVWLSLPPHIPLCSYLPQVDYRTEDGTANAGSDYEFAEGTLLFKPGETQKGKKNKK